MASSAPPPDPYEDNIARARSALAVLSRAAAELSNSSRTPNVDEVLQNLRNDLHRQHGQCA
ncbi:hypothetical protein M2432_005306 [Mycobacterium sp. OTB74]|jgi:hypothetical protein|nr:hypothetical protein [Mycobacterium sp. OTB74]